MRTITSKEEVQLNDWFQVTDDNGYTSTVAGCFETAQAWTKGLQNPLIWAFNRFEEDPMPACEF